MQDFTIKIPDNKVGFFMELIRNLGFVTIEKKGEGDVLSASQMQMVEEARKEAKAHPELLEDWDDVKNQIDWEAC
jgi:hypothetical protein